MIYFKKNIKKSPLSLKIIVVGILISSFLTEPSFANGVNPQYEDTWQNISGILTEDDATEIRYDGVEQRLVDNYELFDAVGQSVSIYIKGNPNDDDTGLCNPVGLVYDVEESPLSVVAEDDNSGAGGADDSYDGFTCSNEGENFYDTFFTVDNWNSDFRIQVSSFGTWDESSVTSNSGDYTLYVSVGNFSDIVFGKYKDSWQNISGSLTIEDARENRYGDYQCTEADPPNLDTCFRLVDNYELFDAVGQSVSIYIKGNPSSEDGGLCDPMGLVYDVNEVDTTIVINKEDDEGAGRFPDGGYDGLTCANESDDFFDTFFTVDNWSSDFRIQVTANGELLTEDYNGFLETGQSGDYTLYVSVGNFGLNENSSTTAPWIGAQTITCPTPNPWVKEQLGFATNAKPVLVSAENTIGKTITQSSNDSLKNSGVEFDTVSKKVSTATETLPIYGCKDKLLSGKVNQPIQFIAGGYTLQSDAHGYINTADLKWHDTNGVTLYTNTAAFMHTIKFTKKGKFVVVLTEQPDTSRGLIPTYGVRSIRFVININ